MKEIIIVFPKAESALKLKTFFQENGFPVAGAGSSGMQALKLAGSLQGGGVVITAFRLPDMTASVLADKLPVAFDLIVLLKPAQSLESYAANILTLPVSARKSELLNSVEMLVRTSSISEKKEKEHKPAQRTEEENDAIRRAKALLMEFYFMSENEAHRFIQKRSMDSGMKLSDTARLILSER